MKGCWFSLWRHLINCSKFACSRVSHLWIVCLIIFFLPILLRTKIREIVPERDFTQGAFGVADPIKTNCLRNSVRKRKGWQWACKSDLVLVKSFSISVVPLHRVGGGQDEGLLTFSAHSFHAVLTSMYWVGGDKIEISCGFKHHRFILWSQAFFSSLASMVFFEKFRKKFPIWY